MLNINKVFENGAFIFKYIHPQTSSPEKLRSECPQLPKE